MKVYSVTVSDPALAALSYEPIVGYVLAESIEEAVVFAEELRQEIAERIAAKGFTDRTWHIVSVEYRGEVVKGHRIEASDDALHSAEIIAKHLKNMLAD